MSSGSSIWDYITSYRLTFAYLTLYHRRECSGGTEPPYWKRRYCGDFRDTDSVYSSHLTPPIAVTAIALWVMLMSVIAPRASGNPAARTYISRRCNCRVHRGRLSPRQIKATGRLIASGASFSDLHGLQQASGQINGLPRLAALRHMHIWKQKPLR
ncbi:uncharacterized protein LY79DRAFT_553079 [Colletotrichum navitas]|uniref:Uncharacterized protein n=1 Tax=Colletotrichum navitas TaxID=681940 RepID=A0AAD8V536_9PEZI|nr:uncharacterized protein LY79DRAFT_553079 [Colletotrichum navitas]KAK1593194.1 hypothetical protein LY79DRAFT_553079 [Colletotrichum navitas]